MAFTMSYYARVDSNSANNPALNLTGAPATQITFVNETATGGAGDLILDQPTGGGVDPDTQVVINGTSYSFTFELTGNLPTTTRNGAQQVPDQFEGSEIYIVTVQDYPSAGDTTRFAFMPGENATAADMDAFGNGAIDIQNTNTTPPPSPVCFHRGTLITTPQGEIPVEDLRVGESVVTADSGPAPIRWIGRMKLAWPGNDECHKPILIRAGALGPGMPVRDLVVSPQHRMLLSGAAALLFIGEPEVLVPAKYLVGVAGVGQLQDERQAEYFHILLDRHEILTSDGAMSESFFPGVSAMQMLSARQRREVLRVPPVTRNGSGSGYGPLARREATSWEARLLVRWLGGPDSEAKPAARGRVRADTSALAA